MVLRPVHVKFLKSYANKPIYLFGGAGRCSDYDQLDVLLLLFIRRIFFLCRRGGISLFQMSKMFLLWAFQSILDGPHLLSSWSAPIMIAGKANLTHTKDNQTRTGDETAARLCAAVPRNFVR